MSKKKLVMAILLAFTLSLSMISTAIVHAQEATSQAGEVKSTDSESQSDEPEQSTSSENESDEPELTTGETIGETDVTESESTEPEPLEYEPSLTLVSSTWTGQSDIVLEAQAKGGNYSDREIYLYVGKESIGGIRVTPEVNLDSDGNGKIVFKNSDLQNAAMFGPNGEEEINWSEIDQMEIGIYFERDGQYKGRIIYVPVDFAVSGPTEPTEPTEPSETTTITNESGEAMVLPEGAPDQLELTVTVSGGAEEKAAVQKVIQVDGDKIKTFDLSLLFSGQPYEYNGQFTSTVSLPVPEGWNLDALALYYFNESTKEVTPVLFSVDRENGTVVFATNHFSKYVLVQKDAAVEDENGETTEETVKETTKKESAKVTDTPKTGDSANVGLYTALLIISALGIAAVALLRKKI